VEQISECGGVATMLQVITTSQQHERSLNQWAQRLSQYCLGTVCNIWKTVSDARVSDRHPSFKRACLAC